MNHLAKSARNLASSLAQTVAQLREHCLQVARDLIQRSPLVRQNPQHWISRQFVDVREQFLRRDFVLQREERGDSFAAVEMSAPEVVHDFAQQVATDS